MGDAAAAVARAREGGGDGENKDMTVAQFLASQKKRVGNALPKHIESDRFLQIVMTEVRKSAATGRTPNLADCTVQSLLGSVLLCAQLGLMPGPLGHAYLVPYKNRGVPEVQFQLGYKGIIDLAYRSGRIAHLVARPVYEGDEFDFEYGLNERLVHKPNFEARGGGGKPILYYGVGKFAGGGHHIHVMSPGEIETYRVRAQSQTSDELSGPWKSDYVPMACKTVIRRMAPFLPLSTDAGVAIEADEQITHADAKDGELVTTRLEEPEAEADVTPDQGSA